MPIVQASKCGRPLPRAEEECAGSPGVVCGICSAPIAAGEPWSFARADLPSEVYRWHDRCYGGILVKVIA